jgi:hypothetical protein
MKKTTIALGILERELVRQIIKLAAEGPLAQPAPMQPVKPNTAEKVVQPIKQIPSLGKTTGAPASRSMFDRQGPGDAQARAAIYGKTKQLGSQLGSTIHGASSRLGDYVGSMLPVGRPGNSGLDNRPMSIVDTTLADVKQMGSDIKQVGTQLNNARLQAGGAIGNYVGSKIPASQPGNSGFGAPPDKPMSMADEMRGTFKQMGSDVQQMGSAIYGASAQLGDRVGSMLPGAKPGNSGYGNAPAVSAYGAAPPQGPMGTGIPGPGQDPAAYGAAPPQGPMGPVAPTTPTIPPFTPTPQMKQFLQANNIQTSDDLRNLTEEQRLQFDDLYAQQQQPAAPGAGADPTAWGAAPPQGPVSASGQPAPQTPQPAQAATPAQPPEQQQNVPNSVKAWGGSLPEQATTEQREQADQAEQQLKDLPPGSQQKLQAAASNPNSPEAQEVKADGANNYVTQSAADPNNPPPTDPRGYGEWAQGKLSEFGQLDPMAQLAIGAGLSIGVVSMLSSMMGGGGMGGMLLGALGLGTAGLVGASTGMLGNDAKGWVNDAFSGLVTAFGGNVPNEADIRARLETAAKQGPEAAKAELEKVRGEVKPYAAFSQDAGKFLTDSANPNFMYDHAQNYGRDNYAKLVDQDLNGPDRSWRGWAGAQLGLTGEAAKQEGTWSRYFIGDPEKNVADRLARGGWEKQYSVNVMRKAARCWAGYEPVPGKKPYSNNSCRPKGSKKTKKDVIQGKNHSEKKAAGPGTSALTIGTRNLPQRNVTYRKTPMTADEAARIKAHFAGRTDAYAQNMAKANAPEDVRQILEGYGRSNYGKNNKFTQGIAGILGGPNVPAPAVAQAVPTRSPVPAPASPAPAAKAPAPVPVPPTAPATAPKRRPDGRPSMTQQQPTQTTSTSPAQPPVSSIGANGQYQPSNQPSVFSSKGVGLPR